MGKYSGVTSRLPVLPADDQSYQDRVDKAKGAILLEIREAREAPGPPILAERYAGLRAQREALETALAEINLQVEAVSQLLTEAYEGAGVQSITLRNGSSVGTLHEPVAQVEDRELCRVWCLENGYGGQMTLPWSTLNAIVKERLLAGQPEPPGVRAYVRVKPVLRGAKG